MKQIPKEKQRQDDKPRQQFSNHTYSWGQSALYPPGEQRIPSSTLGYVVFRSTRLQNTLIVTILERMMELNFGYSQNCPERKCFDSIWKSAFLFFTKIL